MDSTIARKILDYHEDSLTKLTESQRDIYLNIEQKVNRFLEKGGLNIILVTGLRGTGKSTILKTIAKRYQGIYSSGDFMKTNSIDIHTLTQFIKSENKQIAIIDEILYLSDWGINLKIDSDSNKSILYVISGSSAMQLNKISQDLLRRMDIYKIFPLSFREFLRMQHNINIEKDNKIKDLIFEEKDRAKAFLELAKIKNNLPKNLGSLFSKYYETQFPYLFEEFEPKHKLVQMVEKVIYKDLPQIDNLYAEHLKNADLILKFLTTNEKTNYSNISRNLGLNKDLVSKIIGLIEDSDLINIIPDIVPTRELRGNKKILFSAPSIRLALNQSKNSSTIGFAREDMFGFIVTKAGFDVRYNYSQDGYDYLANEIKFEIGNIHKKVTQGTIVIGDFLDIDYNRNNNLLYIPFYLFALIN